MFQIPSVVFQDVVDFTLFAPFVLVHKINTGGTDTTQIMVIQTALHPRVVWPSQIKISM